MTLLGSMPTARVVAVVAIGGDDLIGRLQRHLHADDDSLLADVEVAEAADVAHAVELPGLFLEAADEQHAPVGVEPILTRERADHGRLQPDGGRGALGAGSRARRFFGSHAESPGAATRGCP